MCRLGLRLVSAQSRRTSLAGNFFFGRGEGAGGPVRMYALRGAGVRLSNELVWLSKELVRPSERGAAAGVLSAGGHAVDGGDHGADVGCEAGRAAEGGARPVRSPQRPRRLPHRRRRWAPPPRPASLLSPRDRACNCCVLGFGFWFLGFGFLGFRLAHRCRRWAPGRPFAVIVRLNNCSVHICFVFASTQSHGAISRVAVGCSALRALPPDAHEADI